MNTEQQNPGDGISFNYEGFQVVRGEFLSRFNAPLISFGDFRVWVNSACLSKLPGAKYIQFLVNPGDRKLLLRPCADEEKDSFVWCTEKDNKRKPRKIICRLFLAKLTELMNWNFDCKYRILGTLIKTDSETMLLFDLNSAEVIYSSKKLNSISASSSVPIFPEKWKENFGVTVEEHLRLTRINVFEGYTVFTIND